MSGTLVLCATPIGNLGDTSSRLAEALDSADVVFAEDTRRTRILVDHLGISVRLESYHAGNEGAQEARLAKLLGEGAVVALVTDAGMPSVSDPGTGAVRVARAVGAAVTVVPGPSAVVAALAASGLAAERFVFEGFLPRKGAYRRRRLEDLRSEERTVVLFAAKNRVVEDLAALAASCGGNRQVVVCRELTKVHEEIWSGSVDEAVAEWTRRQPRGEFTIVVAGRASDEVGVSEAVAEVVLRMAEGVPMSDAVKKVADAIGVRRRRLYEAVLREQPEYQKRDDSGE
jgi:16S rRNA (cytidine1402-2'-O)-methyltransferase